MFHSKNHRTPRNQQINSIIPKHEYLPFYVYFCAKRIESLLRDLGSGGSATLNVNTTSFSNIDCIIPPDDLLKGFDSVVKPMFEKILSIDYESTTIAQIRDALLPKLMRGEIDV